MILSGMIKLMIIDIFVMDMTNNQIIPLILLSLFSSDVFVSVAVVAT